MAANVMHEIIEDCKRRQKELLCLQEVTEQTSGQPGAAPPAGGHHAEYTIIEKPCTRVHDDTDWSNWVGPERYLELVRRLTHQSKLLIEMHARGEQLGNPPRAGTAELLPEPNPIVDEETEEALGSLQKDRYGLRSTR